ncbi:hypothetical protein L1049_010880 [Liquidambar formosana]|uniref:Protein RDM1 n=1 Tax=Liquidambar formosana TaxID=63359 RepID=A0AAP0RQX1_LIQFO
MLRRYGPFQYEHLLLSDSETESDDMSRYCRPKAKKRDSLKGKNIKGESSRSAKTSEEGSGSVKARKEEPGAIIKRAESYQESMKMIKIPSVRESTIPFITWQGLAKSMKNLYGQPLHYLTHVQLKQWDQMRIGTEEEHKPMDNIIHPRKAEDTIWHIEEIHRFSISHHHLANLWLSDPMYEAFVDPISPSLET